MMVKGSLDKNFRFFFNKFNLGLFVFLLIGTIGTVFGEETDPVPTDAPAVVAGDSEAVVTDAPTETNPEEGKNTLT